MPDLETVDPDQSSIFRKLQQAKDRSSMTRVVIQSDFEEIAMHIKAGKFAVAAMVATAVVWILCSLIVAVLPSLSMQAAGHMMHTDFSGMQWNMHWLGFVLGLVLWTVSAGVFAWLLAFVYNRQL